MKKHWKVFFVIISICFFVFRICFSEEYILFVNGCKSQYKNDQKSEYKNVQTSDIYSSGCASKKDRFSLRRYDGPLMDTISE